MSHKRVSQLVELTGPEAAAGDLFYIIDVSAKEGKKITVESLADYLAASGSLTAISATNADTASYILGYKVSGAVTSSLTSLFSSASISASWASASISSSHAVTASYAENVVSATTLSASWASSSLSSSLAQTANNAVNASASLNLIYPNLSTASYAMRSGHATTAATASLLLGTISSASYALIADQAYTASDALSSRYLTFDGTDNGTASYALIAETYVNKFNHFGFYSAIVQDSGSAIIHNISVTPSLSSSVDTSFEAFGSAILFFTSSVPMYNSLSFHIINRNSGVDRIVDVSPIYFNPSVTVNNWDNNMTGSMTSPFRLIFQDTLEPANYYVEVTSSSPNLVIDPSKTTKFSVYSYSDQITVQADEDIEFIMQPDSINVTFSSSINGGPFTNTFANMIPSGSNTITELEAIGQSAVDVRYTWKATALSKFVVQNNLITRFDYKFPTTLSYFDCSSNPTVFIYDLTETSMSTFICANTSLESLPLMPDTITRLECYNSPITSLTASLPLSLSVFLCDETQITSVPTMPQGIVTASFSASVISSFVDTTFPDSMSFLSVAGNPLVSLPSMSVSMSYLDATSCSLSLTAMDDICYLLDLYGNETGSLYLRGNGIPLASTITNYISPLSVKNWTVEYDT